MAECEVCCGMGLYPVINKYGSELYSINCPECSGSGDDDGAAAERKREQAERHREAVLLHKYQAAMAEKREGSV